MASVASLASTAVLQAIILTGIGKDHKAGLRRPLVRVGQTGTHRLTHARRRKQERLVSRHDGSKCPCETIFSCPRKVPSTSWRRYWIPRHTASLSVTPVAACFSLISSPSSYTGRSTRASLLKT